MILDDKIAWVPSPNFSSRRGSGIDGLVVHYTGSGSAAGAVRWLCDQASRVSAHFLISRTGRIVQMVRLADKAWHAGVSEMLVSGEMKSDANLFTVGIELANHGWLQKIDGKFFYELGGDLKRYRRVQPVHAELEYDNGTTVPGWWETYADAQLDALQWLRVRLNRELGASITSNMVGHEEIAMPFGTRKRDVGAAFPWSRFSRSEPRRTSSRLIA